MKAEAKEFNQQGILLAQKGNLLMAAEKFAQVIDIELMCCKKQVKECVIVFL